MKEYYDNRVGDHCINLTENALNFLPRLCKYMMMVKELCRVISRSIKFIMTDIISNFTYEKIAFQLLHGILGKLSIMYFTISAARFMLCSPFNLTYFVFSLVTVYHLTPRSQASGCRGAPVSACRPRVWPGPVRSLPVRGCLASAWV